MTYVITEPCIGVKDASCVDVAATRCDVQGAADVKVRGRIPRTFLSG